MTTALREIRVFSSQSMIGIWVRFHYFDDCSDAQAVSPPLFQLIGPALKS